MLETIGLTLYILLFIAVILLDVRVSLLRDRIEDLEKQLKK